MFVLSFKASKLKITTLFFVLLCIVGVSLAIFHGADSRNSVQSEALSKGKWKGRDTEEIRAFLAGFGWETPEQPEETVQVLIPEQFDEVMLSYNAIQKAQGADLSPYAGKTVTRYTFVVTNFYEGDNIVKNSDDTVTECDIRANVLVYNGKIIGGDVCSLALGGFMQGFAKQ